jgi:hypothetical protein
MGGPIDKQRDVPLGASLALFMTMSGLGDRPGRMIVTRHCHRSISPPPVEMTLSASRDIRQCGTQNLTLINADI